MKLKAFVINNVPYDEELLRDFVEGTLGVDVRHVEYSRGAVLVTLAKYINLNEAAKVLEENQHDLGDLDVPLEILNPDHCDDMVVVDNLDQSYISLEFLKLYIESTFADGCDVVCKCDFIPECNRIILGFTRSEVVANVLENQDHTPLPSEGYHIQIKPFYRQFHSAVLKNTTHQKKPSEDVALPTAENFYEDTSNQSQNKPKTSQGATDYGNSSNLKKSDESDEIMKTEKLGNTNCKEASGFENSSHLKKKEKSDETPKTKKSGSKKSKKAPVVCEEKETLKLPKQKWKLLKDNLKSLKCKVNYQKKEEMLVIQSTDAVSSKSDIIDLVSSISKSTKKLNKDAVEFLQNSKVKDLITKFVLEELENTNFEIDGDSLIVISLGKSDANLEELMKRFLNTKTIQIPEGIPMSRIRECYSHCDTSYLLTISYNDDEFTLTGVVEDVSLAGDDIKQMIKEYQSHPSSIKIVGKDALFVKRYELKHLEMLLRDVEIIKKNISAEEIYFQYKCKMSQSKDIDEKVKILKNDIRKSAVDLGDWNKVDIALVRNYLKTDSEVISAFQMANSCCVVFEDYQDIEFLGASAPKSKTKNKSSASKKRKGKGSRIPRFESKRKRVKFLNSCKLQIKPFANIAREKTDLLVCAIDESLDLSKTKVSQAFLKLDVGLQNQMNALSFSGNGVFIDQRNLPKTKCKAIAFITLNRFQQGVSEQRLQNAVNEVLETANKMGVSSVSFPPLGVGRFFKFPVNAVAQAMVAAIDNFLKANSGNVKVKLINCLAPDRYLYGEMNKVVDVVFKRDKADKPGKDNDKSSGSSSDSNDGDSDDDGSYVGDDGEELEGATALHSSSEEENEDPELEMEALDHDKPLSIVIVHTNKDDIASKFKNEIKKNWLFVHYFKSDKITCWSPKLMNDVIKTAKALGVWVTKAEDPATKQLCCKIKGRQKDVFKMKSEIYDKIVKIFDEPNKTLFSTLAPKRDTKAFLKHAANCNDHIPSYWNQKASSGKGNHFVDVDDKTSKAIINIVMKCWEQGKVGQGNDATNIPVNSKIKVIKVQRLENHSLFLSYSMKRRSIFKDMEHKDSLCKGIRKLRGSKGEADTMKHLPSFMKKELYKEINELYLFHGTKSVKAISEQGMDHRLSSRDAMLGQGVYTAESSTKSDQYADSADRRAPPGSGSNLTMILTRVTLGEVFLLDKSHPSVASKTAQKLRRPPCTKCLKDLCSCGETIFNSVLADGGWLFREFAVYDNHQCYPEYFITYNRI